MTTCPILEQLCPVTGSKRSVEQLRRYFSMVKAAYENWPEDAERQFSNPEECRKFLQMTAGYWQKAAEIPIARVRPADAAMLAEAAYRASKDYAIAVPNKQGTIINLYVSKSISFAKLEHREAGEVFDKISDTINEHIGISGNELLERQKEVA